MSFAWSRLLDISVYAESFVFLLNLWSATSMHQIHSSLVTGQIDD